MRFQMLHKFSAGLLVLLMFQPPAFLLAQDKPGHHRELVNKYYISSDREPQMSQKVLVEHLQKKVKYVFVLYQENRSFDSYFGTFPGAEGLFSHPAAQTPGFYQQLIDTDGSSSHHSALPHRTEGPVPAFHRQWRSQPATCYAADTDDIDHSHPRIVAKMDIQSNVPLMDQFAVIEELKYSPTGQSQPASEADGRTRHGV